MRQLAAPLLALALLASPLAAADNAAPAMPGASAMPAGLALPAPVFAALNLQLGRLSRFQASAPSVVAAKLADLAGPAGSDSPSAEDAAVSALMIKRALTDNVALKSLFEGLQDVPDGRGILASETLAELRESLYESSNPSAVKIAFEQALAPLEDRVGAGRSLSLGDLSALYDGAPEKQASADAVLAPQDGPPSDKIQAPLRPAQAKGRSAQDDVPDLAPTRTGIILQGAPDPRIADALTRDLAAFGPLPAGIGLEISTSRFDPENPQVGIYVDGRPVYWEYLYHSESALARQRLSWDPRTWLALWRAPSEDVSRRIAATLQLARQARTKPPRQARVDDWLLRP